MIKEFSSIVELAQIKQQKSRLSERERELSTPAMANIDLIPVIYQYFLDILAKRDCSPNPDSVLVRKKFLFIVLFLFAPSVLAGGRLPNGIRAKICKVFPKISPCCISNNIADITFIYQRYKEFRADIDSIYTQILERLGMDVGY